MGRESIVRRTACACLLAVSSWVVCSNPASAQVDEPPAAQPTPLPEAVPPLPHEVAPLEEEKIDQFADAYLAIEEIHARAAVELKQTPDADSANKVKAAAETQIIEAVEQSGLRLDEFNQIAELMANDVDLRTKIARRVEERRRI